MKEMKAYMFDARPQDNAAASLLLVTNDPDRLGVYRLQFGCKVDRVAWAPGL